MDHEKELILRAQKGDKSAFCSLIEENRTFIFSSAMYKLKCREDAEDITQETFFKAYRKISSFRFECKFSTWLYSVLQNCILDFYRKKKRSFERDVPLSSLEDDKPFDLESDDISPEDETIRKMKIEAVRRTIMSLPDDAKTIIILRDINGESYENIAKILQISEGAVKSRLFRAREKLKAEIEKTLPIETIL
ncbi:MAG: sigma-70 family RNA polymerase sigma factor [Clostridia bacterium]|nr:sigma-70 family RNA polymerase sigma factor [Clostridia bacterium]